MSLSAIISLILGLKDIIGLVIKLVGLINDIKRHSQLVAEERKKVEKLKQIDPNKEGSEDAVKDAARDVLGGF